MVCECGGGESLRFSIVDGGLNYFLCRDDGAVVGVGSMTESCAIS